MAVTLRSSVAGASWAPAGTLAPVASAAVREAGPTSPAACDVPGTRVLAERRADAARRQRARVAMRQRPRARLEQAGGVAGHPPAALDLLLVERERPRRERGRALLAAAHLGDRPGQVHSRRARGEQDGGGLVQVVAAGRRERVAVGGRDPDGRRAADRQLADRISHVGRRVAFQIGDVAGKPALVEQHDRFGVEADDLPRLEV